MDTQRSIEWFRIVDGESVGTFPLTFAPNDDYICPKCGQPAEAWEGVIDQDYAGNDIRGWSYDCYHCNICTEPQEHGG